MIRAILVIAILPLLSVCVSAQENKKLKKTIYEEVDLENVMKRYFGKSFGYAIEGIYSVSCVITKRNKKFLSKSERIRIVGRQDNYAKVAIMKDWPTANRDFIEVSLSYKKANHFPIMGELDIMANGAGYVYTHLEPDGQRLSFSMVENEGLLEAEFSEIEKRKTVTYRLSYLKIFPTTPDVSVSEFR
jgi:hypothetical protein